jgi:hypothetical protein
LSEEHPDGRHESACFEPFIEEVGELGPFFGGLGFGFGSKSETGDCIELERNKNEYSFEKIDNGTLQ